MLGHWQCWSCSHLLQQHAMRRRNVWRWSSKVLHALCASHCTALLSAALRYLQLAECKPGWNCSCPGAVACKTSNCTDFQRFWLRTGWCWASWQVFPYGMHPVRFWSGCSVYSCWASSRGGAAQLCGCKAPRGLLETPGALSCPGAALSGRCVGLAGL